MKKYNKWLLKHGLDIPFGAKYIHHTVSFDGVDYSKIHIGKNVVISRDTIILIHDFSIEAGLNSIGCGDNKNEARFMKDVYIGDNCFVGARCVLLPGCKVGNNCIVGAGSVLSGKEYEPDSIIVGNPARVIGSTREWAKRKLDEQEFIRGNVI